MAILAGFVAGLLALGVFGWLVDVVIEDRAVRVDHAFTAYLQHYSNPALDTAARIVSLFGSQGLAVVLVVLLVVLLLRHVWRLAAGLVITTGGAQVLNDVLKEVFHRTRPAPELISTPLVGNAQSFSFPSGHAMVAAAFYFFLAYLAWRYFGGLAVRLSVAVALLLLVLAIGLARIYLEAHWLSDVVAGYAAGFLWTEGVMLADHLTARHVVRHLRRIVWSHTPEQQQRIEPLPTDRRAA